MKDATQRAYDAVCSCQEVAQGACGLCITETIRAAERDAYELADFLSTSAQRALDAVTAWLAAGSGGARPHDVDAALIDLAACRAERDEAREALRVQNDLALERLAALAAERQRAEGFREQRNALFWHVLWDDSLGTLYITNTGRWQRAMKRKALAWERHLRALLSSPPQSPESKETKP